MAYLHGGAYVSGGADLDSYTPTGLVERGVVGVNISYRLGVFGFQPIPDIAPANLGLLDQVEALCWIKKNIAAFGGDPDNVTLFGQSAGAGSIYCLMLAEGTDGLFHKAILQSAPLEVWTPDREEMVRSLGRLAQKRLATDTRPRSSQEMVSLQTELLLAAAGQLPFGPLLGYAPLPSHPDVPEKIRKVAQRIPIMLGYTKDEGVPFVRMNKALRPYINLPFIGQFIERIATWVVSGKVFTWLTDCLHKQYLEAGGQATLYRFHWHPSHSSLRAAHCIELPFLLGSWESWKSAPMIGGDVSRDAVDGLGDRLKDVWVEFANHGNDNIQGFTVTSDETKWNIVNH
ncbi:Para-nitrobenzyl esterase [Colletotrichum siamense]|uniref:Carboxylic ester hydrolase n=1 Tax=Colletotrichum siamense TaxID=690259 RepID=A0A9P5K4P6_COLSI|nr:Para-nitrobenzyl esterase [Colletotrichum siamense]KAF4859068.1 Para-nitrobenzyl esterase [Colletotrichum siamense]